MTTPTFTIADVGTTDSVGNWSHSMDLSAYSAKEAGDVVILQVLQDGSTSGAVALTSVTGTVANLAGTSGAMTSLGGPFNVGNPVAAYQHLWIGRLTTNPSGTITFSGTNSTSEDVYIRLYFFKNVTAGTTLESVIENSVAGSVTNSSGTGANASDASVTTLGPDRLALNFIAVNDDNAIAVLTGMTGGAWAIAYPAYAESSGTDGAVVLQVAVPGGTYQPWGGGSLSFGTSISQAFVAASFVARGDATRVHVYLGKSGSPTDNVRVTLRTDNGGEPSSTILWAGEIAGADITAATSVHVFDDLAVDLSVGTTYWLVLGRTGGFSGAQFYVVEAYNADIWPGSVAMLSVSGVWTVASNEVKFGVYDRTAYGAVVGATASITDSDAWGVTGFALIGKPSTYAPAGHASGTGAAYNPTIEKVEGEYKEAPAGHASGTGAAYTTKADVQARAGLASGTGAAHNASASVQAKAGLARTSSNYDTTVLGETGLIGYFPIDEPAGSNGTAPPVSDVGTWTPANYPAGAVLGQPGLLLNDPYTSGTFDYNPISFTAAAGTFANIEDGFSVELWIANHGADSNLFDKSYPTIGFGQISVNIDEYDTGHAVFNVIGYDGQMHTVVDLRDPDSLPLGRANHIVAVYDGAYGYLYVNGQLKHWAAQSNPFTNGAVGNEGTMLSASGDIAKLAIYDVALTLAQIRRHYALGTTIAYEATGDVRPSPATAQGTGVALNPPSAVEASIGLAQGAGSAFDATTTATSTTEAPADPALGSGAAYDTQAAVEAGMGVAQGTGAASNPSTKVEPPALAAAGTGEALGATINVGPLAAAAAGTGTALDTSASIAPTPAAAQGTGVANGAVGEVAPTPSPATGAGSALDTGAAVEATIGLAEGTGAAFDATVSVASFIEAQAEAAQGSGAAFDTQAAVEPTPSPAQGTGAALDTGASVEPTPNSAQGTGSALDAGAAIEASAAVAQGTGAAADTGAAVEASIGLAEGAGAAQNAPIDLGPTPYTAEGTGVAQNPGAAVEATIGAASGTGVAYNATVNTSSNTNAPAGTAAGSGAAFDIGGTVEASIGGATGTGAAANAGAAVEPSAGAATGAGGAFDATVQTTAETQAQAQTAAGSGASYDPSASIAPTPEVSTGSGAALNPSPSVEGSASIGTGTGTANEASATIEPTPTVAAGTGAAFNATVETSSQGFANPSAATGTGTAYDTGASVAASIGVAQGSGTAFNATVQTETATYANAGLASGSGAAYNPGGEVVLKAGLASGTGTTGQATVNIQPNAGSGQGTGSAFGLTALIETGPAAALGSGAAYSPGSSLVVNADYASGSGGAFDTKINLGPTPFTATGVGEVFVTGHIVLMGEVGIATGFGEAYDATIIQVGYVDPDSFAFVVVRTKNLAFVETRTKAYGLLEIRPKKTASVTMYPKAHADVEVRPVPEAEVTVR